MSEPLSIGCGQWYPLLNYTGSCFSFPLVSFSSDGTSEFMSYHVILCFMFSTLNINISSFYKPRILSCSSGLPYRTLWDQGRKLSPFSVFRTARSQGTGQSSEWEDRRPWGSKNALCSLRHSTLYLLHFE